MNKRLSRKGASEAGSRPLHSQDDFAGQSHPHLSHNRPHGSTTATPSLANRIAYSVVEAIEVSGLGCTSLYALMKAGKLAKVKIGRRTLIPAESLHALISGEG